MTQGCEEEHGAHAYIAGEGPLPGSRDALGDTDGKQEGNFPVGRFLW
jgi:hypothetical protein